MSRLQALSPEGRAAWEAHTRMLETMHPGSRRDPKVVDAGKQIIAKHVKDVK